MGFSFPGQKKDRRLGVSEGKRHYDLPLNKDESARFLVMLVALMTFLAVMALAFSFALGGLVDRWSSGLENKLTIEIPAETKSGETLGHDEVQKRVNNIYELLSKNKALRQVDILEQDDIGDLLEPWMGENFMEASDLADIPIPGLIAAEIHPEAELDIEALESDLRNTVSNIHIDQHEDWLMNLLRFTSSLQLSSLVIVCVIIATTLLAVAGAIRSRMAEYKGDVELLHLMGAQDEYITRQFQRHARIVGLQGGIVGLLLSLLAIALLSMFLGNDTQSQMPELELAPVHFVILAFVPVFMCLVTSACSRYTVLHVLSCMP